ncbi:MAG: SAM-dependent chlorinase/fluorinase [Bacillota bacterium]
MNAASDALPPVPLIALLTDFGASEYAGVVKGVMAAIWPPARFVDLSHDVGPHSVREGAWILLESYRFFPPGTLFFAVVDPGVGTQRPAVAVESRRYRWVGPDNGLLFPAVEDDGPARIVNLPVSERASSTFHGRDVFAPAAARWASGARLEDLGSVRREPLVPLRFYRRGWCGEVVRVDRFGNLITALTSPEGGPELPGRAGVTLLKRTEKGSWKRAAGPVPAVRVRTYGQAPPGALVVLTGSAGTLEVARVGGSAAAMLGGAVGDRVRFRWR